MITTPQEALQKFWGYASFRSKQLEIITSVLNGKDTFALLPTGGGKSLCYQIPAVTKEGITLVISPLLSLMKDQVVQLEKRGIKALHIPGGIKYQELDVLLDNCIYGNYKLLYLSPERLQNELVLARLKQMNINLLAIDEAHCISQWGHDFRPAYRNIQAFREQFQEIPCIALTATATAAVQQDIITQLALKEVSTFKDSFKRKNLAYKVLYEESKQQRIVQLFKQHPGSGIVYVRSRKSAHYFAQFLNEYGVSAHFYHGGLGNGERQERFAAWSQNKTQVMVATSAFGMGIDKADVQTVIHVELPESLESYFQEAGRAGRNGQQATSVILFNNSDKDRLTNQFLKVLPSVSFVKKVYKKLNSYFQISYGEGEHETFRFDFTEFCKTYDFNTLLTYNALQLLDRNSVLLLSQEFYRRATLQFSVSAINLTYYLIRNPGIDSIVKSLLRTYSGIYDNAITIDHALIAKKAGVPLVKIHQTLLQLHKDDVAVYEHSHADTAVTFLVQREDDLVINRISKAITAQNTRKVDQVKSMLRYIETPVCRSKQLLAYFEEHQQEACGICDICQKKMKTKAPRALEDQILHYLNQGACSSKTLLEVLKIEREEDLLSSLKLLLMQKKIKITPSNLYQRI